jgi:cytochrome c nitrite reductase small subunit
MKLLSNKLSMNFLKSKGFWLILSAFLVGMIFMAGGTKAVKATSSNEFCISCHDGPKFAPSFANLEHGKLNCVDCHSQGVVKDKTAGVGHMITTIKDKEAPNNYENYTATAKFDPNKCISCHNLDAESKTNYIKNRHTSYLRNEMSCTSCHDQKFVHGFD